MKEANKDDFERLYNECKDRNKDLSVILKRFEDRYHSLITHATEGVMLIEFDPITISLPLEEKIHQYLNSAHVVECNDVIAHICGYSNAEEFVGTKISDFINSTSFTNYEKVKEFMNSNFRIVEGEFAEEDRQGNTVYLYNKTIGIVKHDQLIRIWYVTRNVTEQKKVEVNLKESEEKYRFLAEFAPQNLWTIHPNGKILFVNRGVYEYTGLEPVEYQPSREVLKRIVHPDDSVKTLESWDHSFKTGESFELECRVRAKDGSYRWRLVKAVPQKDIDGNIIKWHGTGNDIHKQKLLAEKLKSKNEELIRINNNLDTFAYTASHDLKSPILNIEGLILSLKESFHEKVSDEVEIAQLFNMLDQSVKTFKGILSDLSEIPKAQKNSKEEVKEITFSGVVDEIASSIDNLIKSNNAVINCDFRQCPTIFFSKSNLRSILFNLINNAIKYRSFDRTPEVTIRTENHGDYVLLLVKDNGEGISAENIDKIFTMFHRLNTDVEGSGVGLYIIKKIITDTDGKIEVESEKGKGSTFKVFLKK